MNRETRESKREKCGNNFLKSCSIKGREFGWNFGWSCLKCMILVNSINLWGNEVCEWGVINGLVGWNGILALICVGN